MNVSGSGDANVIEIRVSERGTNGLFAKVHVCANANISALKVDSSIPEN